jgi:hypothetical protein
MSSKDNKVYRNKHPWKTAIIVFITLLLILIVLTVLIFFSFRKYIVYTSDSVKLEVPWLEEVSESE